MISQADSWSKFSLVNPNEQVALALYHFISFFMGDMSSEKLQDVLSQLCLPCPRGFSCSDGVPQPCSRGRSGHGKEK